MIAVGIDPGARDTAVVVTSGIPAPGSAVPAFALLSAVTVTRGTADDVTGGILDVPDDYLARLEHTLEYAAHEWQADLIAAETITRPSWHVTRAGRAGGSSVDPSALLATGIVLGAVLSAARRTGLPVVRVPPNRHGTGPAALYPPALLDRGGKVAPGGKRRHERAAYDVARTALTLTRARHLRSIPT